MKTRLYTTFLFLLVWLVFSKAPSVKANSVTPQFPACPNPGGSLKVSYSSGTHGIPGDTATHTGSDTVYTINDTQLVQCFCDSSGTSGVQTNWWKINSLSQSQIDTLRNLGWVFIPDGSAWGLDPGAFMAYNSSNSCGAPLPTLTFSPSGPGPAPVCTAAKPPAPILTSVVKNGSQATLTWTAVTPVTHYLIFYGPTPGDWKYSVPNTGNVTSFTIGSLDPQKEYFFEVRAVNDCTPSDGPTGGQVLGASTFAPTGNLVTILAVVGLGLVFLGLSLVLRRHESQA